MDSIILLSGVVVLGAICWHLAGQLAESQRQPARAVAKAKRTRTKHY